jgi:predicted DNA-binding protein
MIEDKISARHIHNDTISVRIPNMVKKRLYNVAEQSWCGVSDIIRNGIKQQLLLLEDKKDDQRAKHWSV